MAIENEKNISEVTELKEDSFYSVNLVRTPKLGRILAYWMVGIFSFIVLFLFFPWTQNIRSTGTLTTLIPEDRPQTINSTIAGRIDAWHVQEGQFVNKGDTIVSLSEIKDKFFDPDLLIRLDEQIDAKDRSMSSYSDKVESLQKQIQALKEGLEISLNKARNKVIQSKLKVQSDSMGLVAMETEYEIAKLQFERQEKLYQQGLKSLTEFESRKLKFQEARAKLISADNKYSASQNELKNAVLELNSLKAEYLDKISKAESELNSTLSSVYTTKGDVSKLKNEYSNVKKRTSFYQVTAPQDGYLVKVLKTGVGEMIKEGEAIATIMPANPHLAVELYVKPMDVPLLTKGRKVRLQFDGWPVIVFSGWPDMSFGTFGGVVAVIDNIDTDGKYRILVEPDPNEEPWPSAIRIGSGAYGWAMLKDVPIWYEIWRQLNGFPPDFMDDIKTDIKHKKKEKTKSKNGSGESDYEN